MNSSSPASSITSISVEHYTEKLEESTSSLSSAEDPEFDPESDLEDFDNVPVIKRKDNAELLPMYTCILSNKSEEEVVGVDDLDLLQYDLEKLLTTNALRTRFFLGQYTQADQKAYDNKKWQRKMPEFGKIKHGIRNRKNRPNDYVYYEDTPKVKVPRYRNFEKFWYTVEPFCAPVCKDNLAFLDTFIKENVCIDSTVPAVGDSFTKAWTNELIDDEDITCKFNKKKLQDDEITSFLESLGGRITQESLADRIYDKALEAAEAETHNTSCSKTHEADAKADEIETTEASQQSCDSGYHGSPEIAVDHGSPEIAVYRGSSKTAVHIGSPETAVSFDKRLKKVLVREGILTKEDDDEGPEDDDIVKEIKKCKQELMMVHERNVAQLNKLRSVVVNNIKFNELQNESNAVDKQMLELYNDYVKTNVQDEDNDKEKAFPEPMQPEFASEVYSLIQQRDMLDNKMNDMTDTLFFY